MGNPRAVRISGPLTRYVEDFCDELAGQGYAPATACFHLRLMAELSGWLTAEGLEGSDLTRDRVEEFFLARRAGGGQVLVSRRALTALVAYLTALGVAPRPSVPVATANEALMGAYRRHLVVDRGLASSTVDSYLRVAWEVLARWDAQGRELGAVTAGEVNALVLRECRQRNTGSAKALVTGLRSWLRYLAAEGLTAHDLAGAVPAVAGWLTLTPPAGHVSCLGQGNGSTNSGSTRPSRGW